LGVSKIVIVGSGTAGLVNALVLKKVLSKLDVTVVSSESIGIIGVGEGSTEHWTTFEKLTNIDRSEMVRETGATFKFGIRFLDWTTHTPDYFHSISGGQATQATFNGTYNWAVAQEKQLTPTFGTPSIIHNLVRETEENILDQTNQFHFDTFLLNKYLKSKCSDAGVNFIEGTVVGIRRDPITGDVSGIHLEDREDVIEADFVVDASGFRREVISRLGDARWESFEDYLPTDSAVVFQTPEDTVNGIKPYTLATAMSSGWMWEIPTISRRGNGYVFSSSHISDEDAVDEASRVSGFDVPDTARIIRYNSGYLKETWKHNCVAVGLSSNFIEPLEATSISASINQAILLTSYIPAYSPDASIIRSEYCRIFDSMMENLLTMISLHYVSNRDDTSMWADQKHRPLPPTLSTIIEIMKYRGLEEHDIPDCGFDLFRSFHFWHVAQGQGLISKDVCASNISMRGTNDLLERSVSDSISGSRHGKLIGHKEALMKGCSRG